MAYSIASAGTQVLPESCSKGLFLLTDSVNSAIVRSSGTAAVLVAQLVGTEFTITKGTATSINVYVENSRLVVQNTNATAETVSVVALAEV